LQSPYDKVVLVNLFYLMTASRSLICETYSTLSQRIKAADDGAIVYYGGLVRRQYAEGAAAIPEGKGGGLCGGGGV
jgi:hypothetical protein